MDFYSSPISRTKLVGGYIISALVVGFIMCMITLLASNAFLFISGEVVLSFGKMIAASGVIILSVLASGSMVLLLVSFFKTSNAFAAASTVIGTLLGFLAGIYIPIGGLPDYINQLSSCSRFPIQPHCFDNYLWRHPFRGLFYCSSCCEASIRNRYGHVIRHQW